MIKLFRISHWLYKKGLKRIAAFFTKLIHFIYNAQIPAECDIGEDVFFYHSGSGVVIHPKAKIENDVCIYQNVTIGEKLGQDKLLKTGDAPLVPHIGKNVVICAGAVILGGY